MTHVRAWTDESDAAGTFGVGALLAIAKALPEFFTENAPARLAADAREPHTYVAEERGGESEVISGFAILWQVGALAAGAYSASAYAKSIPCRPCGRCGLRAA